MVPDPYSYKPLTSENEEDGEEVIVRKTHRFLGLRVSPNFASYVRFHIILLIIYLLGTFLLLRYAHPATRAGECKKRLPNVYSPARDAIEYVQYPFNAAPDLTSPYVGESSPELDAEWHKLVQYTNMRISEEDLRAVNRTSIPLGKGGGYYGEMAVFHELHCVKFLRQAFHMDYYGNSFGAIEKSTMSEHIEHCIEILRQSVMCRGDTTLITFHWGHTIRLPQPDFTLDHECVNWDRLMEWASEHAIDVFEDGMLMHPTLGPSYPNGFREDRPRPPSN